VWATNCAEWCLTQFATAKIGAILVCVNPAYRVYELEYALNKVKCKALVTGESFKTSNYIAMLQEVAPELGHCAPGQLRAEKLPDLTTVIRTGTDSTPGMFNFEQVCQMGDSVTPQALADRGTGLHPDDPINIQFTSGTTGNPKGATLTHHNILNNAQMTAVGMAFTEADRLCIPVPLYHCFGMVLGTLVCVTAGATAVFPAESFEPEATLAAVESEHCTALHGVPTMFIAELQLANFADFDLSSLRTGIMAGAPCPVEVMKQVRGDMHMDEILIGYGQTECSPINHMTVADDPLEKQTESVGRPGPHLEVRISDENGQLQAINTPGEICTRGYCVMHGYWDDDERTRDTIDSAGWLHSGDIGQMDEDGYVQVVGRIKDMIIRGGENIYPREIEEFLFTHPDIQDAAVFGIPDDKFGEQVAAWIQVKEGCDLDEQQIISFCREQIAHYKVPKYIKLVDEFPMTVTGKIQKFVMRENMTEELKPDHKQR
ncbi:MAG: AMP-binding protein, partial [Gammaproteobacteria bacterium]|nr:AMP-binding protein [Gammaproteobacteria bacterium]